MSYFYKSIDKQAVKGFICEDLRVFGIKVPKLEKLEKKSVAESESQSGSDIQIHSVDARKTSSSRMQKNRNGLVFGVPLSSMDSIEDPNIGHVPKFLANIRQYLSAHLDKEGLFRKTGSVARQKDLVQYIEESEGKIREGSQVYDVTSVIKQFFRELPEPLIPYILQEAFVQAAQLSSADSKIYSLNLLCLLLPPSHLSVFRYVLEILSDVSSNWQVNKMTAHNIAVCLTPNLYHSKPNCKQIQLQTETVEICIDNVINIGVVPPSIMEKVVMLKSLEDHQLSNSSALDQSAGSGSVSLRRKKRSGSLQGLVGSIRRSVSKLKNKTSRRSSSVPTDLDKLQHVFDDAMPQHVPSGAADGKTDSGNCATPLIMHRFQERDCVGISADKRRAMMGRSGLQGLPPLGINVSSQDSVITYDSVCQPTYINELSLNSPKTDASRITTPTKRSSWGGLRSPFSKRKRSASAGPTFSPNASKLSKSSSKTKKLIRRLSGGKRKTPDMIGQRLAFDNEDDVADVRQRMPSAPPAFRINSDFGVGDNVECEELSPRGGEQELKVEHVSRSRSKRSRSVRARARSADTRHILRRGRPNHPTAGLTKARLQALEASTPRNSTSSLQSYIEHDAIIAAGVDPLPQSTEPKEAQDWVECGVAEPVYKNVKRHRQHLVREDSFDTRMQVVAGAHSSLFKDLTHDKPVLRASTSSVSGGATGKPPRPEKTISVKKQSSDAKLTLTRASATTLESAEATTRCLSKLEGSSPVSNLETEAGLSTSVSEELTWNDPVSAECRYDKVMDTTSEQPNVSQKALHKLVVKGASVHTMTHADSLADLHDVRRVQDVKRSLNRPQFPERSAKSPRQAPVRIPTVFAKGDPRAMRYKMAADAVRRRSSQGAAGGAENRGKVSPAVNNKTSGVSMETSNLIQACLSPPLRTVAKTEPYIPISTNIVRGVLDSPSKLMSPQFSSCRSPLKEHSPNIPPPSVPNSIPKIKSAMLPVSNKKIAPRTTSAPSRLPKSNTSTVPRYTPYSKENCLRPPRAKPSAL